MEHLVVIQVVVGILLTASILLQNRGTGLGTAFGGDMGGYYAKRGFDKFLVYAAAFLAALFIVLAGINVFLFR